jgi:V/A-type H+/Na+-transporting ATPase subunit D
LAKKLKLTRPELKRHRDALARFLRYLPMLKLKQQQLQMTVQQVAEKRRAASEATETARRRFQAYEPVLGDVAGLNVRRLAQPLEVRTSTTNVAGISVPVFDECVFAKPTYSLFATPAWVDRALTDLRDLSRRQAELDVIEKQHDLLRRELTKIVQRVNLFEKVKIPEAREAIRRIRIQLGDEMTAAVGRAKIAKGKIGEEDSAAANGPDLPATAVEEPPAP